MHKIRTVKTEDFPGKKKLWQVHKDFPGIERLLILDDNSIKAPSFEELQVKKKRTLPCY